MNYNISQDIIETLQPDEVFVFGSNEAGIHGGGAARLAYLKFGAELGSGYGHYGQSYAVPTKDHNIVTLPIDIIKIYVEDFIAYAKGHPKIKFLVTQIGCGLAGLTVPEIAPMFKDVLETPNIFLPQVFIDHLTS